MFERFTDRARKVMRPLRIRKPRDLTMNTLEPSTFCSVWSRKAAA